MERPARRNLFDDSEEEDEENEYQPKPETEEDGNKQSVDQGEDKEETIMAKAEEPVEGQAAEEGKEVEVQNEDQYEEGAIALNQVQRVNNFVADLKPNENDLAKDLDDDDEEYVPQAEPEKPVVVAKEQEEQVPQMEEVDVSQPIEEQKPAAEELPEHTKTNAEKKLKEEAEIAKNQLLKEIKQFHVDDAEHQEMIVQEEDEDPRAEKFTVQQPNKVAGIVKYTVTGVDDEGDFSEIRRFREFYALADCLRIRWPGCYVPSIPEKKVANEKEEFVEERRSLLERFMKEIAKFDYIIYSKEFKVFARGKGEIDKVLYALPKQTPMQVLEKYRLSFKIDEEQDAQAMNTYKDRIMVFQQYLKKALSIMEIQKKQVKNMASVREREQKRQGELINHLIRYEDVGLAYYSNQDYTRRVLTHPDQVELKERIDDTQSKYKNAYNDAYLWIKGEFLDISGMYDGLQGRESVMKAQINCEQKKRDDQKELSKLSEGKTTMKSVFKSKAKKESNILSLQAATEIADQEIIDFKKLIVFLTIYHGQVAIPKFKQAKARLYLKTLNNFCVKEISNAHLTATLFHSMLDVTKE